MPTRRIDGRTIAWRAAGSGAPALLLHCSLAHSGAFAAVMAGLADMLAMRALDQPGHGGTDHDPARDLQEQATADAAALLADRPPAHLVGHSFGGTVALRLAVEAPERVASLTLIEPVQFALLAETDPATLAREIAAEAPFHAAVAAGDWRTAGDAFLARWGAGDGLAALRAPQADYILKRLPLIVAGEPAILTGATARVRLADLASIRCPVLLIAGAESPPAIHRILDVVARGVPQARRRTVPGAGHMVPISHPDAVSGALRDFLGAEQRQ